MQTLARAHVKTLAFEFAPSLNDFLKNLQTDIKQKKLKTNEVVNILENKFVETKRAVLASTDVFYEYANIIISATNQDIRIVGVDSRQDDITFLPRYKSAIATSDHDKEENFLFSQDDQYADNVIRLLAQQARSDRLAVMGGAAHSCAKEKQFRLVSRLKYAGISVTSIILDAQSMQLYEVACTVPPPNGIDSQALMSNIEKETARRTAEGLSPKAQTALAILAR